MYRRYTRDGAPRTNFLARGYKYSDLQKTHARNRGAGNPGAKLTPEQVREIRGRIAKGEIRSQLAGEYGVSKTLVYNIANNRTWKHIPEQS